MWFVSPQEDRHLIYKSDEVLKWEDEARLTWRYIEVD